MIQIKDINVLEGMLKHPAHPKLIALLKWFAVRFSQTVITCAFEERDYPSVHCTIPLRGVDVRSRVFENPVGVVEDINKHFTYDPQRPGLTCALYHDTGRGPHIHLQVHDRTERAREEL